MKYSEAVMQRFLAPRYVARASTAPEREAGDRLAGAYWCFYREQGQWRHRVFGGPVAIALAEWLCEQASGSPSSSPPSLPSDAAGLMQSLQLHNRDRGLVDTVLSVDLS